LHYAVDVGERARQLEIIIKFVAAVAVLAIKMLFALQGRESGEISGLNNASEARTSRRSALLLHVDEPLLFLALAARN